jgi:hypothetical protein
MCHLMTFCENVPVRRGIMELLLAVAGEHQADLKKELQDNYASAGQYLLRLIEDRKERHQRGDQQAGTKRELFAPGNARPERSCGG